MTDSKKLLVYVNEKHRAIVVCLKRHRKSSKPCRRSHYIPPAAVWRGEISKDLKGEFVAALVEYNKAVRKAVRRWEKKTKQLNEQKAAPAFADYLKKLIAEHLAAKPVYAFEYTEEASER